MSFPSTNSSSLSSSGSHILSYPHNPNTPVSQLFTRKELVGKGAYGGVYKGIHNPTGTVVALKVIDLDTPEDDISEIQKEVSLLSELGQDAAKHNITCYHGSYLNRYELWIAMDFASGGSIRTLMKSGSIEEKYASLIVREVLIALSFLHRQGIIHRDVKAANVLLTQTGKILLCDFGVAAHLQISNSSKRSTFVGTPLWMAPEVITDGKLYDTKADIWSLGITLYEIIVGNPPHFGMEPLRACAIIPRSEPPSLPESFESITSSNLREFLSSCLMIDPTNRPTADELSKSKWIKSASKLPMVLLRELIVRYVSWIQSGGQRTSIVGPIGGGNSGSDEEDLVQREDTFELTGQREEGWDFDVQEQDFGVQLLGLGGVESLGDEPDYGSNGRKGGGVIISLDELAAKSNLRPPKQQPQPQPQPPRNHPLLRLFDEESNPYAQTSQQYSSSSSFSTTNPMISLLPSSSLNTLKPTISLPSFDTLEGDSNSDQINLGISLPNFGNESSGFGSSSIYGGAGWGGAGWSNQYNNSNDAFGSSGSGSSPFDTIGPSDNNMGSGIFIQEDEEEEEEGGGGGDIFTTTGNGIGEGEGGTVRGGRRGGISKDYSSASSGTTMMIDSNRFNNPEKEEEKDEEDGDDDDDDDVNTWGGKKDQISQTQSSGSNNGIPGFGGAGNGFKFGRGTTTTTTTTTIDSSSQVSTPTTTSFPSSSSSSSSDQIINPILNSSRKRADTAPSFTQTQIEGGGYPPLGPGLPRTGNGNGNNPLLGIGLPRSTTTAIPEQEERKDVEEGMNRPFGGGNNLNRNFKFGQTRERAATMLSSNNNNSNSERFKFEGGIEAGAGGDRKRSGSDGRRQGLTIMTGVSGGGVNPSGISPSSTSSSSSPSTSSSSSTPVQTRQHQQQHQRQVSSLSTHSYNNLDPSSPLPESKEEEEEDTNSSSSSSKSKHRSNQLSTTSSSDSTTTATGILLTTSPTSSISVSASSSSSFTQQPQPQGFQEEDHLATPLAQPQPRGGEEITKTAIGFPFPPVGDLLVPPSSISISHQNRDRDGEEEEAVEEDVEEEEEFIYEEEEELMIPIIKPLDYSLLKDQSKVEKELEQVLKSLGDWFELVRDGLEKVLEDDNNREREEGEGEGRNFIAGLDLRDNVQV
ncbi:hypothetical protein JCM3765_006225 [Sporobolomyces pararoseus]